MTHTRQMSESEGELGKKTPCDRKCPYCGGAMTYQEWESSCGGYDDTKYTCVNGHVWWVDGPDA